MDPKSLYENATGAGWGEFQPDIKEILERWTLWITGAEWDDLKPSEKVELAKALGPVVQAQAIANSNGAVVEAMSSIYMEMQELRGMLSDQLTEIRCSIDVID